MADIPSLIEGLTAIRTALRDDLPLAEIDWDRYLTEAVEALSRLSASPLPEEIAGLAEGLKHSAAILAAWDTWELSNGPAPEAVNYAEFSRICDASAAALERMDRDIAVKAKLLTEQAREIILGNHGVTQLEKTEIMLAQKVRIAELEEERDTTATDLFDRCRDLEAERDKLDEWLSEAKIARDNAMKYGIGMKASRDDYWTAWKTAMAERDSLAKDWGLANLRIVELEEEAKNQANELAAVLRRQDNKIKELEAERDKWIRRVADNVADANSSLLYRIRDLEAERDAIRAKTIEEFGELLDFAEASLEHIDNPLIAMHLRAKIAATRALNQQKPQAETE